MSVPIKVKVESIKFLSNSEALDFLKEYTERVRSETGTVPLLSSRVLEYLSKFARVPHEKAPQFRERLAALGLKELTIVMVMNICPTTLDELRPLLILEDRAPEMETLSQITNLTKEYCVEQE